MILYFTKEQKRKSVRRAFKRIAGGVLRRIPVPDPLQEVECWFEDSDGNRIEVNDLPFTLPTANRRGRPRIHSDATARQKESRRKRAIKAALKIPETHGREHNETVGMSPIQADLGQAEHARLSSPYDDDYKTLYGISTCFEFGDPDRRHVTPTGHGSAEESGKKTKLEEDETFVRRQKTKNWGPNWGRSKDEAKAANEAAIWELVQEIFTGSEERVWSEYNPGHENADANGWVWRRDQSTLVCTACEGAHDLIRNADEAYDHIDKKHKKLVRERKKKRAPGRVEKSKKRCPEEIHQGLKQQLVADGLDDDKVWCGRCGLLVFSPPMSAPDVRRRKKAKDPVTSGNLT